MGYALVLTTDFPQSNDFGYGMTGYNVSAQFYLNDEQTIACMRGVVERRFIFYAGEDKDRIVQTFAANDAKRFFAFSRGMNGTDIMSGTFGFDWRSEMSGRPKRPRQFRIGDLIVRNLEGMDLEEVVADHERIASRIDLIPDPQLAERLAMAYRAVSIDLL